MQVTLSIIKHLIRTGAAVDITNADGITRRPYNSTIVFYSTGINGLNGIVLRNDENGQLYAVAGRVSNLVTLAAGRGRKYGNIILYPGCAGPVNRRRFYIR